jgi:sugar (pentulose or hexulose) kinase
LREGAERTQKRTHIPITEIHVSGGGSQSRAAMQITADVFGLPASRPHIYETSGLGAAIDAAVGLKLHDSFSSAIREMTHPGETFEPSKDSHKIYNEFYERVYRKMYNQLQNLYREIRKITGYPAF